MAKNYRLKGHGSFATEKDGLQKHYLQYRNMKNKTRTKISFQKKISMVQIR